MTLVWALADHDMLLQASWARFGLGQNTNSQAARQLEDDRTIGNRTSPMALPTSFRNGVEDPLILLRRAKQGL
jgi:hypothetical protein